MTITLGYTTLANVQAQLNPNGLTTNATDDAVIERLVEGASRWIDAFTGRVFAASGSSARYFDADEGGDDIYFDADLCSVSGSAAAVINGDGTDITASIRFQPVNDNPKYAMEIKDTASIVWQPDSGGDYDAAVAVWGYWCYSITAPHDIRQACESIVINAYKNRYGQGAQGAATVTASGVVITPADVPPFVVALLQQYRRQVLNGV